MVDEFQDTNGIQYELVRMIVEGREFGNAQLAEEHWNNRSLCVVGDDGQSIYGWRGSDFRIILGYQKDYRSAKVVKLEENYRSTKHILDATKIASKKRSTPTAVKARRFAIRRFTTAMPKHVSSSLKSKSINCANRISRPPCSIAPTHNHACLKKRVGVRGCVITWSAASASMIAPKSKT
jgi:superfamily I DNA/RNA helicase